jgi:C4-dicarboxylate transporter DctM subunit
LPKIFIGTAKTTGYCMAFVGSATILSKILTLEKIPQLLSQYITDLGLSVLTTLLIINVLLLILGCFMEPVSIIIILAPLLFGVIQPLGVDPIHFGVIMVLNVTIGMCTPPVGINMFVAAGLTGMSVEKMFRWLFPCIGVLIVALLFVTYVPFLSLGLPNIFMR